MVQSFDHPLKMRDQVGRQISCSWAMWLALMHPSLGCIEPMAMIAVVEDMKALSFADQKGRARGVTHEVGRNVHVRECRGFG